MGRKLTPCPLSWKERGYYVGKNGYFWTGKPLSSQERGGEVVDVAG
jgi:hypothetical protein